MKQAKLPHGWTEERIRKVLKHYESQSDELAVREDQEAYAATKKTSMEIPVDLVPFVRQLIARRKAG